MTDDMRNSFSFVVQFECKSTDVVDVVDKDVVDSDAVSDDGLSFLLLPGARCSTGGCCMGRMRDEVFMFDVFVINIDDIVIERRSISL